MGVDGPPAWFGTTLATLLEGKDLDPTRVCEMMHGFLGGGCGEVEMAALLVALRIKGETPAELAAAAAVMREYMTPLEVDPGLCEQGVLDTCGTGGDGTCTFNISTATAIVAAAAGVPVVKHGNRAMSSSSGSADVLAELGVALELTPAQSAECLREVGVTFCLAPLYHPAMRHVGPVRRRLGIRTMFNCLGPLANPARADHQLIGVGRRDLLDRMANALAQLQMRRAILVHGDDGLDEVTLSGPTLVRQIEDGVVSSHVWTPDDFGLPFCPVEKLRVEGPAQSAAVIRSVLAGEEGPATHVVQANAAAALLASGRVSSLRDGVKMADEVIRSGKGQELLQGWISVTGNLASRGG
jgi:anthranilate phosphoribosyltransferase